MVTAPEAKTTLKAADVSEVPSRVQGYEIYALGLLAVIYVLNAMDQSILSSVASSIQAEFGLSDTQVGLAASVFVVVGALAVIPSGYLADRYSRRTIIGIGVLLWSLATLFSGLARSFPQLLAFRAVLGIGESSYDPAANSMVGDLFSKGARGRAVAVLRAAFGIGISAGFIVGGVVAMKFGWRYAFYVAAAPGILLAILALLLREPLRGAAEARGPKLRSVRDAGLRQFGHLLRIRTLRASIAARTLVFVVTGGAVAFLPLYVHRQLGVDIAQAGVLLGIPLLVGIPAGTLVGGWLVDSRSRRTPRAHLEVAVAGLVVGAAGFTVMYSASSLPVFAAALAANVFLVGMVGPALQALSQNIVVPSLRGSAQAMALMFAFLIGSGLAPIAVGMLSDLLHSLQLAFLLVAPTAMLLSAACAAYGLRSVGGDIAAMEESWASRSGDAL
jgi:MFS transporter, Spinster family, sphingosine-1-phosphate transporter